MNQRVSSILLFLCLVLWSVGCASDAERGRDKGQAEGERDGAAKGVEDGTAQGEPRGRAAGQGRAQSDAQAGLFWPMPYKLEVIGGAALGLAMFLPIQYFVLGRLRRVPTRLLFLLVPGLEKNQEVVFRAGCSKIVEETKLRIFELNLEAHLHLVAIACLRKLTAAVIEHALRLNEETATRSLHAFEEQVEKVVKIYSVFSQAGRR